METLESPPCKIQTGRPGSAGHGSLYSILPGIKNNQPCAERIQQEMRITERTHAKMGCGMHPVQAGQSADWHDPFQEKSRTE